MLGEGLMGESIDLTSRSPQFAEVTHQPLVPTNRSRVHYMDLRFGSPLRDSDLSLQSVSSKEISERYPPPRPPENLKINRVPFSWLDSNSSVYATSHAICKHDGGRTDSPISSSDRSTSQSSFLSPVFSSPSGPSTPFSQYSFQSSSPPVFRGAIQPRMQVSSLLSHFKARSYHLEVVQHPQRTAEFGTASSLSRLPLTPPIVAQLTIRDSTGNCIIPETELPFLVAHLSLFTADGLKPLDMGSAPGAPTADPPRRLLYGNLVTCPQKLRNPEGKHCLFFVFPDVSIRWRGQFQIGISLLGLSCTDSDGTTSIAQQGTLLAQARTRPFEVLSHNDYIAAPLTVLTQCLVRQGVRMYPSMPSQPRSHH